MGVGERIKHLRKGKYTQSELAELIGVHETTIRRWEQERDRGPDLDALKRIAHALETSVAYLTGETDDPKRYTTLLGNSPELDGDKRPLPPAAFVSLSPSKEGALLGSAVLPESSAREAPVAWVPVVSPHVKACCGKGNAYAEDVAWKEIGQYPVPFYMVNGYAWQAGQNGVRVIAVEGDSMEPRIHDGDWVLFVDTRLSNGDIGLVKYEGRLMVRGVLFDGNDKVLLRALNKDYEEILVDLTDDGVEFGILGKVLLRLPKAERVTGLW